jgi:hypothetical protein
VDQNLQGIEGKLQNEIKGLDFLLLIQKIFIYIILTNLKLLKYLGNEDIENIENICVCIYNTM